MLLPADLLLLGLQLGLVGLSLWALADAALRPTAAFPAAGKLTKPAWVALLGVCAALALLGVDLIGLVGGAVAVATVVYLVDVRPAVRAFGGPRR